MLTVLTGLPEVGLEAMHCQLVYSEVSAAAAPAEQDYTSHVFVKN